MNFQEKIEQFEKQFLKSKPGTNLGILEFKNGGTLSFENLEWLLKQSIRLRPNFQIICGSLNKEIGTNLFNWRGPAGISGQLILKGTKINSILFKTSTTSWIYEIQSRRFQKQAFCLLFPKEITCKAVVDQLISRLQPCGLIAWQCDLVKMSDFNENFDSSAERLDNELKYIACYLFFNKLIETTDLGFKFRVNDFNPLIVPLTTPVSRLYFDKLPRHNFNSFLKNSSDMPLPLKRKVCEFLHRVWLPNPYNSFFDQKNGELSRLWCLVSLLKSEDLWKDRSTNGLKNRNKGFLSRYTNLHQLVNTEFLKIATEMPHLKRNPKLNPLSNHTSADQAAVIDPEVINSGKIVLNHLLRIVLKRKIMSLDQRSPDYYLTRLKPHLNTPVLLGIADQLEILFKYLLD